MAYKRVHGLERLPERALTPRAILLVGWILFLIYAYPGYMSYDSVWQLQQARHLEPYNDWHPPMMAVLWHVTDTLIAGPFPMLVLQSVAFLLGCYGILIRVVSRRTAAAIAALLLIVPQNIIVLAVIWKDSQMASYMLAAIALLLCDRRPLRLAGYFLIFFATGMRYNAAAATLPIVVLLFARGHAMIWWRRCGLGLALWFGLTALAVLVSAQLIEQRTHFWQKSAAPVDLAGIVRFTPDLGDAELRADTAGVRWVATTEIRNYTRIRYNPAGNFMDVTVFGRKVIEEPTTDADFAAMTAAWKTMVAKHPFALLRHRLAVFEAQLASPTGGPNNVWTEFTNAPWAEAQLVHRVSHSPVQASLIDRIASWGTRAWFKVRSYLILALLLLPLCRRHRLPFVLLCSALCHEVGLFLVAPAIDYRYSHWMVITCMLATAVLFIERYRDRPAAPAQTVLGTSPP